MKNIKIRSGATIYGYKIKKIFDHIQTHAVYEVLDTDVEYIKSELKKIGATKFRIVVPYKGIKIICFKI